MVNQNRKKLNAVFVFLPLSFLLFSCASSPSAPKPETFYKGRSGFSLMAEGASFYLTADVQSSRPILDSLVLGDMTGAEIKDFLDMSDSLTAAIFQIPGERHFYAAASGKFPSTTGGIFFSVSKDWEKMLSASGMPYWYSSRSKLAVSLGAKMAYFSDADPFVAPPGAAAPDALPAMQKDSVLSGWMNNAAQAISHLVAAFQVPIEIPAERLLFAIYKVEDDEYTAALRFETPTATQAAGLVMIFAMARLGIAQADFSSRRELETLARALFSQNPKQDGNALILTTGTMNGKDLALLFNSISVY